MTIDEHIKYIQSTIEWAKAFGGEDDDGLIIYWTEQLEMLEELKWYRNQDFIKREDAIFCSKEDLYEAYEKTINSIPKAEPPFATDTNVGDKEGHYCKHNLNDNECKECNFESLV